MEYMKYMFSKSIDKDLQNVRLKHLDKTSIRKREQHRFVEISFVSLYIVLMVISIWIFIYVESAYSFDIDGSIVASTVIVLPALILGYPSSYFYKKYPKHPLPRVTKEMISECNKPLLDFYKVTNDYIITKCYESSIKELKDKDVLLFINNGKLRIVNDFTTTIKDFGCYKHSLDTITVAYAQMDNLTVTVIESENISLVLGKRAKPYITREVVKTIL